MKVRVNNDEGHQPESEVFLGQQSRYGMSRAGKTKKTSNSFRCFSCNGFKNYPAQCKTVCANCMKTGHS